MNKPDTIQKKEEAIPMKRKILAVLLAAAMLIAVVPAALAEDGPEPYMHPYDEPLAVTIMGTDEKDSATTYDSSKPDRASANQNAWIDAYKQYLNIDVTRITPEDRAALTANLNTMMASGDLPDVMIVPKEMFYVLAENGVLRDVREDFESYDGELWQQIRDSYTDDVWQAGVIDGEMLGIPYCQNFYNNSSVLWVRQDWLDALNLEVPTTIDELEAVAKAFVDNKMGGENTIGLGLGMPEQWTTGFASVMAAYGVPMDTWVPGEDGKLVYSNTLPACKDGLLRLQQFYAEGLLRSDFAVTDVLSEDIANGVCGMYFAPGWHSVTYIHANIMNDENARWTPAFIPTLDGERVVQTTNAAVNSFVVFNADFEHPDVFFRMKELEVYTYYMALPSQEIYNRLQTTEDGYTIWNLMVFRGMQRGDLDLYRSGLMVEADEANVPTEECSPMIQAFMELARQAQAGDRQWEQYRLVFLESYPVVAKLVEGGWLQAQYNGPITENMSLYQQTIDASLLSAMVKVIMGDDISVYESAVADWYANGGQAITDDVNANT